MWKNNFFTQTMSFNFTKNFNHFCGQYQQNDTIEQNPTIDYAHRYSSWHLCYDFFQKNNTANSEMAKREMAKREMALHLGFYLASWGMMRGSSALLNCGIGVFEELSEVLVKNKENPAKEQYTAIFNFCNDKKISPKISPTLTLITKIMLGVYGNMPAIDTYFKKTANAIQNINFSHTVQPHNFDNLMGKINKIKAKYQSEITALTKINLPEMKILDMALFNASFK